MERFNHASRSDRYGSRINRDHSPVLLTCIPWGSTMLAAIFPFFVLTASIPLIPPPGLLFLLAWRLVRPGVIPVWAGLPLGLWNDLFSGQPFGSSVLLFSLVLLAIEIVDGRFPWRNFIQDWVVASLALASAIALGALLSGGQVSISTVIAIAPQTLLSVLAFPIVARMVAALDRIRLLRVRVIG